MLPHVFSWFEEMHINIAITIEERDKMLFVKVVPLQTFIYLNSVDLGSQLLFKERLPTVSYNISGIAGLIFLIYLFLI